MHPVALWLFRIHAAGLTVPASSFNHSPAALYFFPLGEVIKKTPAEGSISTGCNDTEFCNAPEKTSRIFLKCFEPDVIPRPLSVTQWMKSNYFFGFDLFRFLMRNYYTGWTVTELLAERLMLQKMLTTGRTTEIRLAGEFTKTDDGNATAIEISLERVEYALYILNPTTYPLQLRASVTIQNFC